MNKQTMVQVVGSAHDSKVIESCLNCFSRRFEEQAGSGPSWRHILGSKIAKGLQNVKVLVNWGPFYEKNSHNAEKN